MSLNYTLKQTAAKPMTLRKRRFRLAAIPLLFLLPALVLYAIFFVYPFLYSFLLSFNSWDMISPDKTYVGLHNYQETLQSDVFWISMRNTGVYVLLTVPASMVFGLALALAIESLMRGKAIYRFVFYLPVVSSIAIVTIVWSFMFKPDYGVVNQLLSVIGLHGPNWLNQTETALLAIAIVGVWKGLGYNMVLFISGLKAIDKGLYEAASIDGAGRVKRFYHVTLPQLSPVTLFMSIMGIISSFQVFAIVQIMTQGGPNNSSNVVVYEIYQEAFQFFNIGGSTAMSTILFLFCVVITVLQLVLSKRLVHY